jgi:hypothetical protein
MSNIEVLGAEMFPDEELKIVSFAGTPQTTPAYPCVNGVTLTIPPNKRVAVPACFAETLANSGVDALIEDYPPAPVVGDDISVVDVAAAQAEADRIKEAAAVEAEKLKAAAATEAEKVKAEAQDAAIEAKQQAEATAKEAAEAILQGARDQAAADAELKASNAQAEADAILKAARDEAAAIVAAASAPAPVEEVPAAATKTTK